LWWNILLNEKAVNLPAYLTFYRYHPGSMTNQVEPKRDELNKRLYKIILHDIGMIPSEEELKLHHFITTTQPVTSINQLKDLMNWLMKISGYCQKSGISGYKRVIMNRWLKICYKSRYNSILFLFALYHYVFKLRWNLK
jgi:hypothetical protein